MRRARHTWFAYALAFAACNPGSRDAAPASSSPGNHAERVSVTDSAEVADSQWKITPEHFGPITAQTSEADLRQLFGEAVVRRDSIHLGEGEFWPGTILYPDDSLRRVEIAWGDTLERLRPWYVRLAGSRSVWNVNGKIRLGTTLRELERLNGKPFTMSGYGWDYGGRATQWDGGALDTALRRGHSRIYFSLFPDSAGTETKAYMEISGDRPYSSSLPALQQLNPRVWEIFLNFAPGGVP